MSVAPKSSEDDQVVARALAQQILGPDLHTLACGCVLKILCRLPGAEYMYVARVVDAKEYIRCAAHAKGPWAAWPEKPQMPHSAFSDWFTPDSDSPRSVSKDEFQSAFDEYAKAFYVMNVGPIMSTNKTYWIYRSGGIRHVEATL